MIKKSLSEIESTVSLHGCGEKKVLLNANETSTNITQVAIIHLKAGESGNEHIHWRIEEGFFVLEGELKLITDGTEYTMKAGDYVHLQMATKHNLEAITDVKLLTIGCEVKE